MKKKYFLPFFQLCLMLSFFCFSVNGQQKTEKPKASLSDDEKWKQISLNINNYKKTKNLKKLYYAYEDAALMGEKKQKNYLDSLLITAKKLNDDKLIGEAYMWLGMNGESMENYPAALDNYINAYSMLLKTNNQLAINKSIIFLARVKLYMGDYDGAYNLLKPALKELKSIENEEAYLYYTYGQLALIETNWYLKRDDNSALVKEGMDFIRKNNLSEYYPYFLATEGVNEYYNKNYRESIRKITSADKLYTDKFQHLTDKLYLAFSYWELGETKQAYSFLQQIDDVYDKTGKIDPKFRSAFEMLIKYYEKTGDRDKELEYVKKLLSIDAKYEKDYKLLFSTMHKEFDNKKLIETKALLENKIKKDKIIYNVSIAIGVILIIFLIFFVYKEIEKRNKYQKLYKEFISIKSNATDLDEELSAEPEENIASIEEATDPSHIHTITDTEDTEDSEAYDLDIDDNDIDINPKLVESILKELETFEKNRGFLKKKVSLESLSLQCGTNTAYLSKIINHYKKQNFKTYLNDLRLNYVMNLWRGSVKSRKYSIQEIASKAGFSNSQSFSKKFQEKFGVSPSFFLKKLNSNKELESDIIAVDNELKND
ncbi:hypothetical protein DRF59_09495 [Chryseobacterium flavum]|uniref:HTH araC/xylS-type domain-containing protein n=2 Tax=Chryseobacterium flavum TaxID=415851 RepID=A0A3D9CN85_9FLAO|nr:hypothetical protein DRF59_09495 [Chryseobacterium flavum]